MQNTDHNNTDRYMHACKVIPYKEHKKPFIADKE